MSSVRKLPSGRYQARYRDPNGRERSQSFDREKDALRFAARTSTSMDDGAWIDPALGRVDLEQWAKVWLKARVVERSSQVRDESYLRNHVIEHFGSWPMSSITTMAVRGWVAQMSAKSGLAPATVGKCYQLLRAVLESAVEEGLLRSNPCRRIALPRPEQDERVFLTHEQFTGQLLPQIPAAYRTLVLTAFTTGLRWGELAGLRRRRVDLMRGRIEVVESMKEVAGNRYMGAPKSKAARRIVSLPQQTVHALSAHLGGEDVTDIDGLVFVGPKGAPLSRTRFRARVWLPAVDRSGIVPAPRFHDLRHSHAALLIANGVPALAIQRRLGHKDIKTTYGVYGHLYEEVDDKLIAGIEKSLLSLGGQLKLGG